MICVSLGRSRHTHMIAEHRHVAEQGIKLVELRLDYIRGPVNVKRLLADRPTPVIVTCRRARDGGRFNGSEEQRLVLLRLAIAEGVDYVDLEDDIAGQIPRFGKTKRIVSLHDFRHTPQNLDAIYERLSRLDPDVVKIATMANHPDDNRRMLRMVAQAKVPTVGLCMGEVGIPTRVLGGRLGSPFTFASLNTDRILAPGQLSYEEMVRLYRYESINRDTEVYGVVADPVAHSLSPQIHNAAFAELGLNKVYLPFRVPKDDIAAFIDDAAGMGIRGLSVTIPHKEAVLAKLTKADGAVRGIGACNTIVFQGDDRVGYNTDYRAAMDALENALGGGSEEHSLLEGKVALVLGAGGAGKAIAYGLARRKAKVVLSDGDHHRAKTLAEKLGCRAVEWAGRHTVAYDVLVNCTPIGMHPNVDESPLDKNHIRHSTVVFDAVYNPEQTLLIKDAVARDCTVVTGVEMFVRQACLQFKLFTGHEGPSPLMRDVIKRATSAVKT